MPAEVSSVRNITSTDASKSLGRSFFQYRSEEVALHDVVGRDELEASRDVGAQLAVGEILDEAAHARDLLRPAKPDEEAIMGRRTTSSARTCPAFAEPIAED